MRRLIRDALLIGITAAAVWFIRGDAQEPKPFTIQCAGIELPRVTIEESNSLLGQWRIWAAPGIKSYYGINDPAIAMTGCLVYEEAAS